MITRYTAWWQRLCRRLSRSEWSVRWLRLPRSTCKATDHGLLLVQIDGLSQPELQRAIEAGRMPFLRKLLRDESYVLHRFYSGLPSSTPSVQGELFYGQRCAVPAFEFRQHQTGQMVRMFAREVAADVQQRLAKNNAGLLTGGSSYCNIYDGGAQESHFCASSLGWDQILQDAARLKLLTVVFWHGWSIVRTFGLMLIELVLAVASFARGAMSGRELWQELMMIPARVVVVILMRELAITGAMLDAARGLPIIHLNLLGYDEQAHRRGPGSSFAHWTLKGIDAAIRRLWNSVHRASHRQYDVWVFSDHGQETVTPYPYVQGQRLQAAVAKVVAEVVPLHADVETKKRPEQLPSRAQWLGASWLIGKLFGADPRQADDEHRGVQVAALGPLGLIYVDAELSHTQYCEIAKRLVDTANIPLACVATSPCTARAFTKNGGFELPRQAEEVFGADHPFVTEVARDFVDLCHHPESGDVIVSGWNPTGPNLSFVLQNGAHAGPGAEETAAFALLPSDAPLMMDRGPLRPDDLRKSALRFLERPLTPSLAAEPIASRGPSSLSVLTYNVHTCVGMDGELSPARIARVIAQSGADVIALQELDVYRGRTGHEDQAHMIAQHLEMNFHFHPAWQLEEEKYGDAVLSRFPLRLVKTGRLPMASDHREPRGAIWVELSLDDNTKVQLINTHLSIYPGERNLQAEALLAEEWLGASLDKALILCGDFNAPPGSKSYRRLARRLDDVQQVPANARAAATWYSSRPLARIDHIFTTDRLDVVTARVIRTRLASVASDHLPLLVELRVLKTAACEDTPLEPFSAN